MPPVTPNWTKGRSLDLLIESYSNAARTIQVRGFTESEPIVINHVTSADRSLTSMTHAITETPIMLTVRTLETGVKRGACYIKVSLRAEGVVIGLLAAGYVTDAGGPAWPNGKIESSIEGPGLMRTILGTDPAAGVNISETVPTGARWRFVSLQTSLVNDATVANRHGILTISDGTNVTARILAGTLMTASVTYQLTWTTAGAFVSTSTAALQGSLSNNLFLPAGSVIATAVFSLQAGDNLDAPRLLVEEWIEP